MRECQLHSNYWYSTIEREAIRYVSRMAYMFTWLLLLCVVWLGEAGCVHSSKVRNYTPHRLQLDTLKQLRKVPPDSLYSPINITHTYQAKDSPSSSEADRYILKTIRIASAYFNRALKIISAPIYFPTSIDACYEVTSPPEHRQAFTSDLHLYVTSFSEKNESFLAWAVPCVINNIGRPIFGQINFNTYYLSTNQSNYGYQKDIETTIHEIIHVLGFSPSLYSYFREKPTIGKQYGRTTIQTPTLNAWMKQHFNCGIGAPLEDQGSDGSVGAHWERSVFQDEIMTASDLTTRLALSNATLSLLASTGWYLVNFTYSQGFVFGKGQGCEFLARLCKGNFPEYCYSPNEISCTFDSSAIATCIYDSFSNNCNYYSAFKNTVCADDSQLALREAGVEYSYDSRCFKSNAVMENFYSPNKLNYRCFRTKCIGASILVLVNGAEYLCEGKGQVITLRSPMKGTLQCPTQDFSMFCSAERYCENQCNQMGYCLNGQCICEPGRSGPTCAALCDGANRYTYRNVCVSRCPVGTFTYQSKLLCVNSCPKATYITDNTICTDCTQYCKECNSKECGICQQGSRLTNGTCRPLRDFAASYHLHIALFLTLMVLFTV